MKTISAAPSQAQTIVYGNLTLIHNTVPWDVRINRHPTTAGNHWGWIDGPAQNATWSGDPGDGPTSTDAGRVCEVHNRWLEDQKPIHLKVVESRERMRMASLMAKAALETYQKAREKAHLASLELDGLEAKEASLRDSP